MRRAGGEVHDVLGSDDLPRHVAAAAEFIHKTQLPAPYAGPYQAAEQVRVVGESIPPATLHGVDEFGVDFFEQGSEVRELFVPGGRERVHEALVISGRDEAPLDAELVHRADEAEAVHQYSNGAHEARAACVDGVRGRGDVVASGRGDVGDDGIQRRIGVQPAQADDLVIDVTGLNRGASRAVDSHDHAGGIGVLERGPEPRDDPIGVRFTAVADDSADFDEGAVRAAGIGTEPLRLHQDNGEDHHECEPRGSQREAPSAGTPLFRKRIEKEPFEHTALPAGCSPRRGRLRRVRGGVGWLVGHGGGKPRRFQMTSMNRSGAVRPSVDPTTAPMNARFK